MTADEFTAQLPPLINDPLPVKPPFFFNGMSVRVFPLRANLEALQQICDGMLNIIPPEAGRFRVPAPYVILMVIDYGQIAQSATGVGWYSQIEVFFSIQVEWYKLVNGRLTFHDWGVITPYIFVTDDISVPLGRIVYGFPKGLAHMVAAPNRWVDDPMSPITLARLETAVFPGVYAGKRLETKTFFEIERDAPMQNFRIPLNPSSPLMPWTVMSNLAQAAGGFGRDAMWMAQGGNFLRDNPGLSPAVLPEMISRVMGMFVPGGKGFLQNSLNLKQFRRADAPERICYQGITNGSMVVSGFNGGGLLGEERTFGGDLSGGHTVRLYEHSSLPIARTMGLEVYSESPGEDGAVMELKPILPYWVNLDVLYEQASNVAWRTEDGIWKDGSGALLDPGQQPATGDDQPRFTVPAPSSIQAVTGPFEFSGATIRVLPLLAQIDKLQSFLDDFANKAFEDGPIRREDGTEEHVRLSVWARPSAFVNVGGEPIGGDFGYVYLTASSFTDVTSKTNNVGNWAKYELSFNVPVKWERRVEGKWETVGVGLVPAFTFEDESIAAISRSEVQGINAGTGTFVRPESMWLGAEHVADEQTLLRMEAEVWPAFGVGQSARQETIVEISHRVPNAGLGNTESHDTPYLWAETLRVELGTKKGTKVRFGFDETGANPNYFQMARALSLELLGNRTPFAIYTLKQIRDVREPNKACYQEFLRVPRVLKEVFGVEEIEETLVVHLHDFPSLKIAETLGIIAPTIIDTGTGIVHSVQAIRPFFIHADLDEPLAERLLVRAGTPDWKLSPGAFQSILSDEPGSLPIVADVEADEAQNTLDPCKMTYVMFQARERLRHGGGERDITKENARRALSKIDPQMIIEAVLSREWGNRSENARWRRGRAELLKSVEALPDGGPLRRVAEPKLYVMLNNMLALRPGAVARQLELASIQSAGNELNSWQKVLAEMIRANLKFTESQLDLEAAYNIVAPRLLLGEYEHEKAGSAFDTAAKQLVAQLDRIVGLLVQGEPSDGPVFAQQTRLKELLALARGKLANLENLHPMPSGVRIEDIFEVIDLARKHCGDQREAILDKLSRGYQKPDFCLRRDSVGPAADSLLALALSWDEDWYFGSEIEGKPPDFPAAFPEPGAVGSPLRPQSVTQAIGPRLL